MVKRNKARMLKYFLLILFVVFSFAAIVVGSLFKAYAAFWWWDDMLHMISGALLGFTGLLVLYAFMGKRAPTLHPLLVVIFVFCFSMTIGVLWEFYEFGMDYFFGTAMQQYNMPPSAIVIGKSYQGMGLRDTMSDLMNACIGTILISVIAYFAHKQASDIIADTSHLLFHWKKHR